MSVLTEASPRTKARVTAVFYLLTLVLGGMGESMHGRLVVPRDAAGTASNILSHASLLRVGYALYLLPVSAWWASPSRP